MNAARRNMFFDEHTCIVGEKNTRRIKILNTTRAGPSIHTTMRQVSEGSGSGHTQTKHKRTTNKQKIPTHGIEAYKGVQYISKIHFLLLWHTIFTNGFQLPDAKQRFGDSWDTQWRQPFTQIKQLISKSELTYLNIISSANTFHNCTRAMVLLVHLSESETFCYRVVKLKLMSTNIETAKYWRPQCTHIPEGHRMATDWPLFGRLGVLLPSFQHAQGSWTVQPNLTIGYTNEFYRDALRLWLNLVFLWCWWTPVFLYELGV